MSGLWQNMFQLKKLTTFSKDEVLARGAKQDRQKEKTKPINKANQNDDESRKG